MINERRMEDKPDFISREQYQDPIIDQSVDETDVIVFKDLEAVFEIDLIQFSGFIHSKIPKSVHHSKSDELFEAFILEQLKSINIKGVLLDEKSTEKQVNENEQLDDESNASIDKTSIEDQAFQSDNSLSESDEDSEFVPLVSYTKDEIENETLLFTQDLLENFQNVKVLKSLRNRKKWI